MARPSRSLGAPLLVGFAGLALLATPALAASNPAVEACAGKTAGQTCGLLKLVKPEGGGELLRSTVPGVCQADQCCDLDYSKGSPPQSVCHECLACKDGPTEVAPPPAKADDPPPSAGGEPPRSESSGPPPTAPSEQRGCSVGAPGRGPWGWLPALVLLVAGLRRRAA